MNHYGKNQTNNHQKSEPHCENQSYQSHSSPHDWSFFFSEFSQDGVFAPSPSPPMDQWPSWPWAPGVGNHFRLRRQATKMVVVVVDGGPRGDREIWKDWCDLKGLMSNIMIIHVYTLYSISYSVSIWKAFGMLMAFGHPPLQNERVAGKERTSSNVDFSLRFRYWHTVAFGTAVPSHLWATPDHSDLWYFDLDIKTQNDWHKDFPKENFAYLWVYAST